MKNKRASGNHEFPMRACKVKNQTNHNKNNLLRWKGVRGRFSEEAPFPTGLVEISVKPWVWTHTHTNLTRIHTTKTKTNFLKWKRFSWRLWGERKLFYYFGMGEQSVQPQKWTHDLTWLHTTDRRNAEWFFFNHVTNGLMRKRCHV